MGNRIELKINGVDVDDTTPTGAEIVKWAERDKIAKAGLGHYRNCGAVTPKKILKIYGGNCENCNYE